jgi:hypothetical protein
MSGKRTKDELRRICEGLRIPTRKNKRLNKTSLIAAVEQHSKMARAAKANLQLLLQGPTKKQHNTSADEQCIPTSDIGKEADTEGGHAKGTPGAYNSK